MLPYRLRDWTARVLCTWLLSVMAAVVHACVPAAPGSLIQLSAMPAHAGFGDVHAERADACDEATVAAPASGSGQPWQAALPPAVAQPAVPPPALPTARRPNAAPTDRPLRPTISIAYLRLAL